MSQRRRKKKISWPLVAGIGIAVAIIAAGIFLFMSPEYATPAESVAKEIDPNPPKPSNDYFNDGGELASRNAIRMLMNDTANVDFINKSYEHLDMSDSIYESKWVITITGANDKPVNANGYATVKYTGAGILNDPASWKTLKASTGK